VGLWDAAHYSFRVPLPSAQQPHYVDRHQRIQRDPTSPLEPAITIFMRLHLTRSATHSALTRVKRVNLYHEQKVRQFCAQHQLRALPRFCSRALAARVRSGFKFPVSSVAPSNVKTSIRVNGPFLRGPEELPACGGMLWARTRFSIERPLRQFGFALPELSRYVAAGRVPDQEFAAWNTPARVSGDESPFFPQ